MRRQQQLSLVNLAIFVAALIGMPIIGIVSLILFAGWSDRPGLLVLFPASLGAVVGLLTLLVGVWRSPRSGADGGKTIVFLLILGAALLGTFSGHLPIWLRALCNGWLVGFFVSFDVVLLHRLRNDLEFRQRARLSRLH